MQERVYLVTTIVLNIHMEHILCIREILVNQQMLTTPPYNLQVVEVSASSLSVAWDIVHAQQSAYVIVLFKRIALSVSDRYYNTAKIIPSQRNIYLCNSRSCIWNFIHSQKASFQDGQYDNGGAFVVGTAAGMSECGNEVLDDGGG